MTFFIRTLSALVFMASAPSFGQGHCEAFYGQPARRKLVPPQPSSGYLASLPANKLWDITLPEPHYKPKGLSFQSRETRFIDQEMSLECPAFAFINALESAYANHPSRPKPVTFDAAFLIGAKLHRYLEKALDPEPSFFAQTDPKAPTLAGGEFHNYLDMAINYGLVPAEIWRPLILLSEWPFHRESATELPFIYDQVRRAVDIFNSEIWNNQNKRVDRSHPNYAAWKKENVDRIFKETLGPFFGEWPFPFNFANQANLSPFSYSQKVGPSRTQTPQLIYMNSFPYALDHWTNRLYPFFNDTFPQSKSLFTHKPFSSDQFYETIVEALSTGKAIVLDTNGSIDASGHSFAVVDVEIQNGKVVAVKLKNSYRSWPNGYGWFSVQEINNHVRRAWIFDVI